MNFLPYTLFIILLCGFSLGTAQESQQSGDTLSGKSYDELNTLFYKLLPKDTLKAKVIADAYIAKGRAEKDSVQMAKGYYYYAADFADTIGSLYADTIITLTRNSHDKSYPAVGYLLKGAWAYRKDDYKNALSHYITASEYARERDNLIQRNHVRLMIAALKSRGGDHRGALAMSKEYLNAFEYNPKYKEAYLNDPKYGDVYLENIRIVIYNIAINHLQLMELDSSRKYFGRGIRESLKYADTVQYYRLLSSSGSMEYYSNNYMAALDSLDKALPHLTDPHRVAMAHYYKGQSFRALGRDKEARSMLLKSDSIAGSINYKFPELRLAYVYLAEQYKKEQKLDSQLVFIDKMLDLDKELLEVRSLDGEISRRYDTPNLLRQKEALIRDMEQRHRRNRLYKEILLSGMFLLGTGLIYYYLRQRRYRLRYNELLSGNVLNETPLTVKGESADPGVPEAIFAEIIKGLSAFEQKKRFTSPEITLHDLAKDLGTNTTYLSRVINTSRGVNFSQYLHGLRIDHIIQRLRTEERLRAYSIQALAEEAGYNTSQSFTRAFYHQTGIYPSYFIKKLTADIKNSAF